MKRLNIDLGARSYGILIGSGLLSRAGEFVTEVLRPTRVAVVTHPALRELYGETLMASLGRSGFPGEFIEIPEGETSKSLEQMSRVYDRLIEFNCDRRSVLVALGGGVVGDLTGFVAATYYRGVPFIQVPTTLLSQVDSSVGGKTAVNHPRGKNLIGAFNQPRQVLIDLDTLRTLPLKEFRAGLAEIVKYGVIADPGLFRFLEEHVDDILSGNTDCLAHIIETSCAIKGKVVEKDELENRYRMILNFGHTLGHAIESLTEYSGYIHGEAVAIGMVYAARLSRKMGKCGEDVCQRIETLLQRFGLPTQLPDLDPGDILESMFHDKKAVGKKIRFVLVEKIGTVDIVDDVPEPQILDVLA